LNRGKHRTDDPRNTPGTGACALDQGFSGTETASGSFSSVKDAFTPEIRHQRGIPRRVLQLPQMIWLITSTMSIDFQLCLKRHWMSSFDFSGLASSFSGGGRRSFHI
jgi:hypothetical protein